MGGVAQAVEHLLRKCKAKFKSKPHQKKKINSKMKQNEIL
jgi:hypothetical protein